MDARPQQRAFSQVDAGPSRRAEAPARGRCDPPGLVLLDCHGDAEEVGEKVSQPGRIPDPSAKPAGESGQTQRRRR